MSDPPILSRASSKATAKKTGASESTTATRASAKTTVPQQTGVTSTAKATASTPPAATTTVPKSTGAKARAPKAAGGTTTSKPREVSVGTDAAFASGSGGARRRLKNISEVRHFFRTNDVPIYFFGATAFNLLGLDRWVRNFSYITYYDAWDGAHSRVFTPRQAVPGVRERRGDQQLAADQPGGAGPHRQRHGRRATQGRDGVLRQRDREDLRELGYDLILPPASLREHLDSKIVTTRLGNEAGAPSVPNVLTKVKDWAGLQAAAEKAGLGDELVVQTPYGDSGKTTFFIASEADWKKHSDDIVGQEIKVMRRINNRPVAVEAVLTRCGTIVGPFMSELIGYKKLTPAQGGWCGNEMFPEVLTGESRRTATQLVRRLGDRLAKEGYRGFFEVDVLVDTDTDDVYLGELNPRISGASSITNVTAGAYADIPLFLFHILEYMNVDFDLDVDEINERWEELASEDVWSQMVMKETDDIVQQLTATPRTGQYSLDASGALVFRRAALDWHQLQNEAEAFFLRIYGPGDYRWKGADLGVVVTKGRLQVDSGDGKSALAIRARHLIDSIRAEFAGMPIAEPSTPRHECRPQITRYELGVRLQS